MADPFEPVPGQGYEPPSESQETIDDYLEGGTAPTPAVDPASPTSGSLQGQTYSSYYQYRAAQNAPEAGSYTPAMVALFEKYGIDYQSMSPEDAREALTLAIQAGGAAGEVDPLMSRYLDTYLDLWGTSPPEGYIEKAMKELNLFEFEEQERAKPSFRRTQTYRNETGDLAESLSGLLGYR